MNNPAYMNAIRGSLQRQLSVSAACFRGLFVACHIIYGMLLAAVYPALGGSARRRILKQWSRKLLGILHVGLETSGSGHAPAGRGQLFVANHISWLDVIAMNAVAPACFVAKAEVRDWPLLGWMCRRIGTLFIRRDARQDAARVNCEIVEMLRNGECVALFPEGTSTEGIYPGHFHSSLLQGPIDSGAAIHPLAIRYHDGSSNPNLDAAYVDDMTFIQSLWKILRSPSLHATLAYLPALQVAGKTRRTLAAEAQGAIHTAIATHACGDSVHTPDGVMGSGWRSNGLFIPETF